MHLELTDTPNSHFAPNDDDCDRCPDDAKTPALFFIAQALPYPLTNHALCRDHAADYLLDAINS